MDADGVVFRDYAKAPAGLPRVQTSAATRSDALQEAAEVIAALPGDLAPASTTSRSTRSTRSPWCCATAAPSRGGAAEESDTKARGAAPCCSQRRAETYDVSVPGQPTTSG